MNSPENTVNSLGNASYCRNVLHSVSSIYSYSTFSLYEFVVVDKRKAFCTSTLLSFSSKYLLLRQLLKVLYQISRCNWSDIKSIFHFFMFQLFSFATC